MKKLNLPNKLVIFRFILAIAVIAIMLTMQYVPGWEYTRYDGEGVNWMNVIGLSIYVLAALTDWLDGYLARKNNQITTFGKYFDPLADKFLVNSMLIIFAAWSRIPIWMAIVFIGRDLIVDGIRMAMSSKGKVIAASKLGKWKTAFQMIGLMLLFVCYPASQNGFDYSSLAHLYLIPLYIALTLSLISGYQYVRYNIKEVLDAN